MSGDLKELAVLMLAFDPTTLEIPDRPGFLMSEQKRVYGVIGHEFIKCQDLVDHPSIKGNGHFFLGERHHKHGI